MSEPTSQPATDWIAGKKRKKQFFFAFFLSYMRKKLQWPSYWLHVLGFAVRYPLWTGSFTLPQIAQTGSGDHPLSCLMVIQNNLNEPKAAGKWSWTHITIRSRDYIKYTYTSNPPHALMENVQTNVPCILKKTDIMSHQKRIYVFATG
jgi:hypothetical protein